MNEHIEGRPVSASTYTNHGCRCDGCRAAKAAYHKKLRQNAGGLFRSDKAFALADRRASQWVRANLPELWDQMLREAHAEVWS